jgi:hypothetical protein
MMEVRAMSDQFDKAIGEHLVATQAQDWKVGFATALRNMILQEGAPSDTEDIYYGWIANDYSTVLKHMEKCSVAESSEAPTEEEWDSFDGTFVDSCTACGFTLLVSCVCGKVKDRTWRWEGSMADAVKYLVTKGSA